MDFTDINLKSVFNTIIKNPIRKIFAIIFAFGLWFYVSIDKNYNYQRPIEIEYVNISNSLIMTDSVPSIDVRFTGRGGTLFSIWAAPPKAQCDLGDGKLGKNTIAVRDLTIPAGFGFISISYPTTKTIDIVLDKKITKDMQVTVPIKKMEKGDYAVSAVTALDTVVVIGPQEIINSMTELVTESLDVKVRETSFTKEVNVINPSPLLQLSQKTIVVKVEFEPAAEKSFTNIPLKLIYSPNQKVSSDKITLDTLVVRGPQSRMTTLGEQDIEVRITLTKLSPGNYELPAQVMLPDYIRPTYARPQKFKVRIY
jgi:YbbR domain-containing protein